VIIYTLLSLMLILVTTFFLGALFQVTTRQRGYARETIEHAAPALSRPAYLGGLTVGLLFITIIFLLFVYFPYVLRVLQKQKQKEKEK